MQSFQLWSGEDGGSDKTSVQCQIDDLTTYGVQITFTGNLDGILTLEASNDNVNYITIDGSAQTVTASTNHFYNVEDAAYKFFRIVWDYTSGAGTMSALVSVKQPVNRY